MVTDKTLEKQGISPPVQREILFVLSYPQLRVTYISAEAAKLNKTRKKFGNLFLLFRFDFSSPGRLEDFFAFFRGSERKKKLFLCFCVLYSTFPNYLLSSSQIFLPLISAPTSFHDWGLVTRWA